MRTRDEIEQSFKEIIVPAGSEGVYKLFFELLLDVRETLIVKLIDNYPYYLTNFRQLILHNAITLPLEIVS